MSIRLEIDGEVYEFTEAIITLGSDPGCTVLFPESEEMTPCHAVIRKISGRWSVEVRDASFIQVGDEPKSRMYWLNQGDVIRMTDNGPNITFQPGTPKFNPVRESPGKREVSQPDNRSNAGTPGNSGKRQTPRPRPPVMPPMEEEIIELEAVEPDPVPSRSPKKPRSSLPAAQVDAAIPEVEHVPVIATEAWMDSTSAATAARQRRARRTFWLQMGLGGALALVAVGVWKFGQEPARELPALPAEAVVVQTVPQTPPDDRQPVVKVSESATPSARPKNETTVVKMERPPQTVTEPETIVPTTPVVKEKPTVTTPVVPVPEELLTAVSPAIFTVLAKKPNEDGFVRLGTAWVASRRHLVTSGAVALAVEDLRREGMLISVSQPSLKAPVRIKDVRVHDAYRQGIERAAKAREQIEAAKTTPPVTTPDPADIPPEVALAQALSSQVRFDLGVLEIATGQRLPSPLEIDSSDLPNVTIVEYTMVGSPFSDDDNRMAAHSDAEAPRGRVNPVGTAVKSDKTLSLTMPFADDVADANWSGSPVLDHNRRVIGVYSRPSNLAGKKDSPQQHAVIWLGRLREFAPEVEE